MIRHDSVSQIAMQERGMSQCLLRNSMWDLYLEEYILCEKGILPVHGVESFSGLDDHNPMD